MTITFLIILLTLTLFVWIMCQFIREDDWEWVVRGTFVYKWDLTKPPKTYEIQKGYNVSEDTTGTHYVFSPARCNMAAT